MAAGYMKEIILGDDFGDVVVKVNGISIEAHVDGSVDSYTNPGVRTYSSVGPGTKTPVASPARKPGDRMQDGTIFAGISPDTGDAMYVTPADAPRRMSFNEAATYAAGIDAHGHQDWRLPSKAELHEIYRNRHQGNLNGTFNEVSGSGNALRYWSCTENCGHPSGVHIVDFTDGGDGWSRKDLLSLSSRPLRAELNH
jgi:hypothetical protein